MKKLNNATMGLILNGITQRLDTIKDSCEDEQTVEFLTDLCEDITLVVSETLDLGV